MLSVLFRLLNLGVNHFLPSDMLRVGLVDLLLYHGHVIDHDSGVEVSWTEALSLDIDWHIKVVHLLVLHVLHQKYWPTAGV